MPLTWIIPARRAVVSQPKEDSEDSAVLNYEDLLDAWIAELREHRETLLGWYGSLVPGDLGPGFDRALATLEGWVELFKDGASAEEIVSAVGPGIRHEIHDDGYWARLWKGPLRVLLEARDAGAQDSEAQGEEAGEADEPEEPVVHVEISVDGGPAPLVIDRRQMIVLNHDARFLPGDVVELPLFRFWAIAGVPGMTRARFNPEGSCFLGTSVVDHHGAAPGSVRLHDNALAMRFQLLLNLSRGAFYSLESGWKPGTANLRKSRPKHAAGHTVHARGMVYGSVLQGCGHGSYWAFTDLRWGTHHVPSTATFDQLASETRLTAAWSCTPFTRSLTCYLCNVRDGPGRSGGVNAKARDGRHPPDYVGEVGEIDYLHHRMLGPKAAQQIDVRYLWWDQAGLPGFPNFRQLRERGLRRLFLLPPAPFEEREQDPFFEDEELEAALDGVSAAVAEREQRELEEAQEGSWADRRAARRAAGKREREREESRDLINDVMVDVTPDDDSPKPSGFDISTLIPVRPGTFAELDSEHIARYLEGSAFVAVGLNGHEYCWVMIHPHDALLAEDEASQPEGVEGPPTIGRIAAYDPLDGRPYVAPGQEPKPYHYEASGSRHLTRLPGPLYNFTVMSMKPSVFRELTKVYIKRESEGGDLKIGEQLDGTNVNGNRKVRGLDLISMTRFDEAEIRARHADARSYEAVFLRTPGRRESPATLMAESGYHERAVPFPTLDESSADESLPTLGQVQTTINGHRQNLNTLLSRLDGILRGRTVAAGDRSWYEAHLGSFPSGDWRASIQSKRDRVAETLEKL